MYIDFHNDTILRIAHYDDDFVGGSDDLHVDLPKILSVPDIKGIFFASCPSNELHGEEAYDHALRLVRGIKKTLGKCADRLPIALSSGDFERNIGEGKPSAFLTVEGGTTIDDNISNLDKFYDEGVRLLTLAHLAPAAWIGSCHEKEERGLSKFGADVVKRMNELGMIVDVAHVSERAIYDVIEVSKTPVVFSHGGVKAIFDNERTLSDDAIRAIASSGGVVSIMFFPDLLAARSDIDPLAVIMKMFADVDSDKNLTKEERILRKEDVFFRKYPKPDVIPGLDIVFQHIDHVVNLVGDDCIALGSDYDGIPYACTGLEHIGKIENLSHLMFEKGYSEERIAKIMGINVRRIISNQLPVISNQ